MLTQQPCNYNLLPHIKFLKEEKEHKPNYAIFCRWAKACGYQLTLQSIKTKRTPIPMTKSDEQSQTHNSGSFEEEN